MKAIVLAGGYAKRLWPLTKERAKPLVDINGRPIISYILDKLEKSKHIKEIIISTNAKFEEDFKKWLSTQRFRKPVKIVVENSNHEGEKLGAVGGLDFVLGNQNIRDYVLVIGGDNLTSVDIDKMIGDCKKKKRTVVAVYDLKKLDDVKKFAEVVYDKNRKIVEFIEKPENPKRTVIATCCYIFPRGVQKKIKEYILDGNNKDAPGFFLEWLSKREDVFAYVFDEYWFDIGDHTTLEKAREFAKENF